MIDMRRPFSDAEGAGEDVLLPLLCEGCGRDDDEVTVWLLMDIVDVSEGSHAVVS